MPLIADCVLPIGTEGFHVSMLVLLAAKEIGVVVPGVSVQAHDTETFPDSPVVELARHTVGPTAGSFPTARNVAYLSAASSAHVVPSHLRITSASPCGKKCVPFTMMGLPVTVPRPVLVFSTAAADVLIV